MLRVRVPPPEPFSDVRPHVSIPQVILLRSIAMLTLSALCMTAMHGSVAMLAQELHPFEVAFFRNLFGFVALMPALVRSRFNAFRTTKLHLHTLRGLINSCSMLLFFTGLSMTPLAEATALTYTAPLWITIGVAVFLGETIRIRRISALIVGFCGMLIVLRPGFDSIGIGPLCVLASSLLWAIAVVDIKVLTRTDSSLTIATYMLVFLTPITFLAALFHWTTPSLVQLAWLFLIGVLGSTGQILFTEAFRNADVSVLMPFDFTKLIFASILGYLAFGQVPDVWTWLGGTIIFASACYIGIREHKLKQAAGS